MVFGLLLAPSDHHKCFREKLHQTDFGRQLCDDEKSILVTEGTSNACSHLMAINKLTTDERL